MQARAFNNVFCAQLGQLTVLVLLVSQHRDSGEQNLTLKWETVIFTAVGQ